LDLVGSQTRQDFSCILGITYFTKTLGE